MSEYPLVGCIGCRRGIVVGTSNLVMLIRCGIDDGLTIVLEVNNEIILMSGIIWNSYGSVECWGGY